MLPRLVCCLLNPTTGLFISTDRVTIRNDNNVLVLVIIRATHEQLCNTLFNSAVCVCALADIFDVIYGFFEIAASTRVHFHQAFNHLHLVTVVQSSRIPGYVAVTWLASILQFIDEAYGEIFDLVEVIVSDPAEGHTLRCVQHKEQIHRALGQRKHSAHAAGHPDDHQLHLLVATMPPSQMRFFARLVVRNNMAARKTISPSSDQVLCL